MTQISNEEVAKRLPNAWIDQDNVEFFRGLLQRKLLINRCDDCQRWHQPPWPNCPTCWSDDVTPTEVSGRGTIHSVSILRAGPPLDGVDYAAGYPVAVIELEEQEGLRVTATLVGGGADELGIGTPVELAWIERDGEPLPAFGLRTDAA
ncbi:OB-fold domain-containing protein [Rhodococcus sp. T2V]|uniref:Zn-ribbon domain-containing OB-fold protein n=1 Tax=Rhodococcus sp. T2V TaxID=3034164 RepID=UPI0023E2805B|nr:OB-fold domain-containing protein [Rhodococcus sp. T2V]MDF3309658.1 OB-fold domain-containing protein [Rhodococcus sp. T2V]